MVVSGVTAQPQVGQPVGRQPVSSDASLAAQPQVDNAAEPTSIETLQQSTLASEFASRRTSDSEIAAANSFMANMGFEPQTGQNNYWGQKATYASPQATGRTASPTQPMMDTYEIQVQDYAKRGSGDQGAIARISVSGGGTSEVYTFALIAKNGDFDRAEEYMVVNNAGSLQVVMANSWWSCTQEQLKQKCLCPCALAIFTCPTSTWSAYLGCLANRCGVCFVKASACCACNCKWWCQRFAGCCHQ